MPVDVADLYKRHGAMVKRRAAHLLHDESLAQDVVQEVFLRLWREQDRLVGGGLASWLYTTATRMSIDHLRRRAVRANKTPQATDTPPQMPSSRDFGGPDRNLVLRQVVDGLPEELALVALYRFVDEMTHDEIASVTGHSRRHVGNLLQRAERHFQELRHDR